MPDGVIVHLIMWKWTLQFNLKYPSIAMLEGYFLEFNSLFFDGQTMLDKVFPS
jgi:hypothetical protein